MKFLRNLLAVLVGLFIFSFLGFLLMIGIISVSSSEKPVKIEANSVLLLELNGQIVERAAKDPFENLSFPGGGPRRMGLKELKEAVRHAKDDENIKGIFLFPKAFTAGFSSLGELRAVLKDFRESGKFIITYGEFYTEKAYYLASVADEIYLIPDFGSVELNGLNITAFFIKGMLEKLEVEPEIFKVGDFKSAVEPFLREDMSPESREQTTSFLNSIYDQVLSEIAEDRNIPLEKLRNISDSMLVKNVTDAVQLGIITGQKYYDEVCDLLKEKLELEDDEEINFISYKKYNKSYSPSGYSKDRIAVIVGSGEIVYGKGMNDNIGGTKFAKEVRKARENEKVKAIVLRINSPGGSALASDMMWREIRLAAEEKPVIASMSDVAASGGYYMAMGADKIYANPATITGSIGIFGMLFNAKDLLSNKLGITTDVVKTGEFSDLYTITRPLSDFEKSIIQKTIDEGYVTFTSKAAEGRNMELDDLLKVASGRVWSGIEAKEIGLVDELGSLDDAIKMAAEMAELEEYRVSYYPHQKTVLEQLMEELGQDIETKILRNKLGDLFPLYEKIQKIEHYNGILMRMPYDIEIN